MRVLIALLAAVVEVLNTSFPVTDPAPPPTASPRRAPGDHVDEETESPPPGPLEPLGSFEATCYALTGTTASGAPAGPGSIAVDRRVIPLGTRLVVEGYGPGDARDTGGAIRGNRVDVWLSTAAACRAWGRRSVRVWVAP